MESLAYSPSFPDAPDWLNKGDNAWQLTAATFVGIQSMPGLVVLYGSIVKKKWAVNSAFMALYAFAATYIAWIVVGFHMAFGTRLCPFWGKGKPAIGLRYTERARFPSTQKLADDGTVLEAMKEPFFPQASLIHFEFTYAAITLILLGGSVLGRMSIRAWIPFVPLWLIFSYTVGAFSLWGGGFLYQWGVLDYSGGYVIHVSSGVAGFVAAYWVGPRIKSDKERFSPNNILLMLAGAGFLWLGWSGFNGGAPYTATASAAVGVLNTNLAAATSLLSWTCLDIIFFGKPSVIGAVQGMMTGLVCITPAAGLVHGWAAFVIGVLAGIVPWFSMMVFHKKSAFLQQVDDTLAVFHTHAVTGILGGILTGFLAETNLCEIYGTVGGAKGVFYGGGMMQLVKQIVGALFMIVWNVVVTTAILFVIGFFVPLRMSDEELLVGDDAAHGEEAYSLWGDGDKYDATRQETVQSEEGMQGSTVAARGVTVQL